jgi:hypothetical protein
MTPNSPHFYDKIINDHLARAALHDASTRGAFKAIVRLRPGARIPTYLKVTSVSSPGEVIARIACSKLLQAVSDDDVVSLELREHVLQ